MGPHRTRKDTARQREGEGHPRWRGRQSEKHLGCGLERQKPLPVGVPAHGAPWAEHQDLEPFLFLLFFPNNCWEKFQ